MSRCEHNISLNSYGGYFSPRSWELGDEEGRKRQRPFVNQPGPFQQWPGGSEAGVESGAVFRGCSRYTFSLSDSRALHPEALDSQNDCGSPFMSRCPASATNDWKILEKLSNLSVPQFSSGVSNFGSRGWVGRRWIQPRLTSQSLYEDQNGINKVLCKA